MSKKLKKKRQQHTSQKSSSNNSYFMIGTIAFLVIIFVIMLSSVIKKDAPTGGNASNSGQIEQILNRIDTRLERLQEDPNDLSLRESIGHDYYDAGFMYSSASDYKQAEFMWDEAIYHYLQVLEELPDNLIVRVNMATIAWRANKNDLAEEHFLIAIEQDPTFFNARLNFGNFWAYAKEDFEKAIVQWEEALRLNPDTQREIQLNNAITDAKQRLQN